MVWTIVSLPLWASGAQCLMGVAWAMRGTSRLETQIGLALAGVALWGTAMWVMS